MKRLIFAIIFIVGLLMCFFAPDIFTYISTDAINELVFCALITIFGGAGLLIDIYKK